VSGHFLFRISFFATIIFVLMPAHAAQDSTSRYTYEDGKIFSVRTGLGIATTLELDPGDAVLDYSAGFSSGWDIVRRDSLFYLKPKNVDVDTNLLIRTQKRSYIIELQVVASDWRKLDEARRDGVQYRVVFDYPKEEGIEELLAEQPTQMADTIEPQRVYNYRYEISTKTKRAWLVPANVYDDGQFTYVRLVPPEGIPSGNFPTVFARNGRFDEDFVVNSSVQGNTLVVHGIYPFLVIRHGNEVVGVRRSGLE